MAFFCTQTGARLVAPGISIKVGGTVAEYEGTAQHIAAETAAEKALAAARLSPTEIAASAEAIEAAAKAAQAVMAPAPAAKAEPAAHKPEGRSKSA